MWNSLSLVDTALKTPNGTRSPAVSIKQNVVHRREVHADLNIPIRTPQQRHSCIVCGLSFPNERLLQRHAAQHAAAFTQHHDEEDNDNSKIVHS